MFKGEFIWLISRGVVSIKSIYLKGILRSLKMIQYLQNEQNHCKRKLRLPSVCDSRIQRRNVLGRLEKQRDLCRRQGPRGGGGSPLKIPARLDGPESVRAQPARGH